MRLLARAGVRWRVADREETWQTASAGSCLRDEGNIGLLDFDTVRKLGLALPDVVEATAYGAPALKLRGKLLACVPTNKSAEPDSIVVHIDVEHRAELLRQHPDVYYITEHYAPHPTVLVRLSKITRRDLTELLRDACRSVRPSTRKPS
jgi:hypothetical protein